MRTRAALPRLLIVEDHDVVRSLLASRLASQFRVTSVSDAATALDRLAELRPDVILTALMLPGMDGIELCRRLRSDPALSAVPVLVLTARSDVEDRLLGLSVANDYMTKPFDIREVCIRLCHLVEMARTGRASDSGSGVIDVRPADDRHFESRLHSIVTREAACAELSVSTLASAMALSERQFRRRVRRATGRTPNDYVRRVRLEIADDLLRNGAVSSIGQVARAVGWTPTHLARAYQNAFGALPSERLSDSRRLRRPKGGVGERAGEGSA